MLGTAWSRRGRKWRCGLLLIKLQPSASPRSHHRGNDQNVKSWLVSFHALAVRAIRSRMDRVKDLHPLDSAFTRVILETPNRLVASRCPSSSHVTRIR